MFTLVLIGIPGGVITGISPCILPVLPIIFLSGATTKERTTAPSAVTPVPVPAGGGAAVDVQDAPPAARTERNLRPYAVIAGLVISFSFFTLLGSLLISSLGLPDSILRIIGIVLLVVIGLGLIFPKLAELLERPFARIPQRRINSDNGFVLGLGLGLVFVPCAGPVLAAITVAGATSQIGLETVVLTLSFALGVAIPLLGFALAGREVAARIRAFRTRQRRVRVIAGVVMILLAIALQLNFAQAVQRLIPDYTAPLAERVERSEALSPKLSGLVTDENRMLPNCTEGDLSQLKDCGPAPAFENNDRWFNTPGGRPIDIAALRGKVVLIDFWTYSCINCLRTLPQITAWDQAYRNSGLQVIGMHSPEFAFERDAGNVQAAISREDIRYPVAPDNMLSTWTNYLNRYWPAQYLIDAQGQVRHIKLGEGDYARTESHIRQLLIDAGSGPLPEPTNVAATTPDFEAITGEQFLGSAGKKSYTGERYVAQQPHAYTLAPDVPEGGYGIGGVWTAENRYLTAGPDARVVLNYRARSVNMVLGGAGTITVDDGDEIRTIAVSGAPDLYPLLATDDLRDSRLTVTASPGVEVYAFAFG